MTPMEHERYGYFPHGADIGIVGRGPTIEAAFEACAEAMFAIMLDPANIVPAHTIEVAFAESDLELALVRWLNALLAEARAAGLALGRFALRRDAHGWRGAAWGEPWRDGLERGVEVKGATLTMLAVRETADGWEARCVVDV
jgi:SHS2 domain-containing protein